MNGMLTSGISIQSRIRYEANLPSRSGRNYSGSIGRTTSTTLPTMRRLFARALSMMIALKSISKGMDKVILHEEKLREDLEDNWAVVSEAIQTILRRENYPDPYEALKSLTRTNQKVNKELLHDFIDKLKVSQKVKDELKSITPHNYTGVDLL